MLRGQVSTMALEDVLDWAVRRRVTGILTAERAGRVRAVGVDGSSGALLLDDGSNGERELIAGEVVHVRLLPDDAAGGVTE